MSDALKNHEGGEGGLSRRALLRMMSATAVFGPAFLACERKPRRKIVSQTAMPEYMLPGEPLYYASTWTEGAFPYGILIKTVDGRPIKIDGNPAHPVNGGASNAAMQAMLLSLYDPDRLAQPMRGGAAVSWEEADRQIVEALRGAKSGVLLTRATLGPSEREIVARLRAAAPALRHFVHEAIRDEARRGAWNGLYGGGGDLLPRFGKAKVILSLDSDFLGTDGVALESAREFSSTRRPDRRDSAMSRLYVVESAVTPTGAAADHRVRLRPSRMGPLARLLLNGVSGEKLDPAWEKILADFAEREGCDTKTLEALVRDLRGVKGQCVVVAGRHLPAPVHALVALLNEALEAHGTTLEWSSPPIHLPVSEVAEVEAALEGGVDALILLGVNPVYDWPGKDFAGLIKRAKLSVAHSLLHDETASKCALALPSAHNLESWNDAAPRPNLRSLCQPVIAPLVDARQEAESLLAWAKALAPGDADLAACKDWHDCVRQEWRRKILTGVGASRPPVAGESNGVRGRDTPAPLLDIFDDFWNGVLRSGIYEVPGTAAIAPPRLDRTHADSLSDQSDRSDPTDSQGLEIVVRPHHAVWDGRFANNGWLQELPEPVSRLVWDNVAAVSPAWARQQGLETGDVVEVRVGERTARLPIHVQPGMPEGVLAVTLGHGREKAGRFGTGVGVNVSRLIAPGAGMTPRFALGAQVSKTGAKSPLVATQLHDSMENRPLLLQGTLEQYRHNPRFVEELRHLPEPAQIHKRYPYTGYRWAMTIDLSACQACGACMVACQAENNVAAAGKEECGRGHWMHWLRIDRYYAGGEEDPAILHQIMLCQHCEDAPCENVCPVAATTHSPEGINEMTYNRCVGTRYCSNNCPYKVRRFNFFDYAKRFTDSTRLTLAHNPNVTVRGVGVMEKCNYCIQRINEARAQAKRSGRRPPDGSVRTACQQACPAGAITFGDLNDPSSAVGKLSRLDRAYRVLEELNTKPRTTYLARIVNPSPGTLAARRVEEIQAGQLGRTA